MPNIYRAKDQNKDQTYFIWQIKKKQLEHILFPVGEFENKDKVRQYAKSHDLITSSKPDSQGLCFVGQTNLREMLLEIFGKQNGEIVTFLDPSEIAEIGLNISKLNKQFDSKMGGRQKIILGYHEGAFLFTIGQRQNLGVSNGPWFVQNINVENNQVIVCHQNFKNQLDSNVITVKDCNWQISLESHQQTNNDLQIGKPNSENYIQIKCCVQVRYRSKAQECKVMIDQTLKTANVQLLKPISSIAVGQSAVFYDLKGKLLGGGIINSVA